LKVVGVFVRFNILDSTLTVADIVAATSESGHTGTLNTSDFKLNPRCAVCLFDQIWPESVLPVPGYRHLCGRWCEPAHKWLHLGFPHTATST
jgi:hypothetical protein